MTFYGEATTADIADECRFPTYCNVKPFGQTCVGLTPIR
jgi:hypothetical protein